MRCKISNKTYVKWKITFQQNIVSFNHFLDQFEKFFLTTFLLVSTQIITWTAFSTVWLVYLLDDVWYAVGTALPPSLSPPPPY